MIQTPDFLSRYGKQFYIVTGIGAFICLIGWMAPSVFGTPFRADEIDMLNEAGAFSNPMYANLISAIKETRLSLVSADSMRSLIFIVLGFSITMLYLKRKAIRPEVFVSLLTVVVLIDLYTVDKRYVDSENFIAPLQSDETFAKTAADEAILKDKSNYRVLDVKDFGGARSSYYHKTIGGYHAAKLTRYNDLIDKQIMKGNPAVLNMLNAKYIMSGDDYQLNPDALGNAWFVTDVTYVNNANEEMAALDSLQVNIKAVADRKFESIIGEGTAVQPGDTIYETSYAPNRLTYKYHSSNGGVAVFSEIYFPWGWTATLSGKELPIGRVNYVLRALKLPAGDGDIEFRFDPESLKITNAISVSAVAIIYILCALAIILSYRKLTIKSTKD
jgi:hypothetical protein